MKSQNRILNPLSAEENGAFFCIIEKIKLSSFLSRKAALKRRYVSLAELKYLSELPEQSLAGIIAVKRALAFLFKKHGQKTNGRFFIISHKKNGAPFVKKVPVIRIFGDLVKPEDCLISISHNKTHACAVACLKKHFFAAL